MRITIKQIDIPDNKRILATSDIHGHLPLFRRLLDKSNFSDSDILFIIGDIIEKGPESLKTLRYIMELSERDNVIVLAGNVDTWRIQMLDDTDEKSSGDFYNYIVRMRRWWGTSIFDEMAEELGEVIDSREKIVGAKKLIKNKFNAELGFLRSLPTIAETQNYIFVHAGLPCDDLDAVRDRNIYDVLGISDFMSSGMCFNKYVVAGHWPVTLYNGKIAQANPIINDKQKIISIDGGCGLKRDGQLNMLIIPDIGCSSDEIKSVYCDDFIEYTAAADQQSSCDSINIRYGDNKIKILERGEEFSYAEHISTGYRLNIFNKYISEAHGDTVCDDYTDYMLPVKAGDKLSLIYKTSEGYIVKKNGVSGWYKGNLI